MTLRAGTRRTGGRIVGGRRRSSPPTGFRIGGPTFPQHEPRRVWDLRTRMLTEARDVVKTLTARSRQIPRRAASTDGLSCQRIIRQISWLAPLGAPWVRCLPARAVLVCSFGGIANVTNCRSIRELHPKLLAFTEFLGRLNDHLLQFAGRIVTSSEARGGGVQHQLLAGSSTLRHNAAEG